VSQAATETPPPSPVSTREIGYAHGAAGGYSSWWDNLTDEHVPELTGHAAISVYDRMRKSDAQVGSVLRAVSTPIVRAGWSVDGRGCRDEVTEFVASNLGLPIKDAEPDDVPGALLRGRDRFSWNRHLRLAMLILPFGHSPFEQMYRWDDTSKKWRLAKLAERLPKSISKFNVARDGGLISIEQFGTGQTVGATRANILNAQQPIPVDRLVVYALEREGGNWRGQSLLRSAYKNWLLKDQALRDWSIHVNRNGAGVPMYYGAEKETNLGPGKKIARDARAGDSSGGAAPYGAKLVLQGVEGTTPDIDKFVRYQDEQIARAVLAHVLNLGTQVGGQVGSYNLGSVLQNTFDLGVDSIGVEVRDTANHHVVEDLIDINFSIDESAPRVVFDPIGSRQNDDDDPLALLRRAAGLDDDSRLADFIRTHVPATQEVA
jgi:hypothetical protein